MPLSLMITGPMEYTKTLWSYNSFKELEVGRISSHWGAVSLTSQGYIASVA